MSTLPTPTKYWQKCSSWPNKSILNKKIRNFRSSSFPKEDGNLNGEISSGGGGGGNSGHKKGPQSSSSLSNSDRKQQANVSANIDTYCVSTKFDCHLKIFFAGGQGRGSYILRANGPESWAAAGWPRRGRRWGGASILPRPSPSLPSCSKH